ncbi:structural protein [Sulfolobales Mexican rudivirus 1]|uniref:Structural protein n=1 Tax=Sulfolobales Mexican rod-shaped virus 1 TaxID=2848122 RepID=K4NZA8_9VIRU|nr:structural protein [Sulfolobales Mexican rudivirus 1]AFV51243.1 structural protein [Sulfolobales Mexican rod-shaped virus 1]
MATSKLPYPVRYKLPLQYLSVDDWNNFVNDLLFIYKYGPGKWLQYYNNGNMSNLGVVQAKTANFGNLTINGYQALWNLKPVETRTFPYVFEDWLDYLQYALSAFNEIPDKLQKLSMKVPPATPVPETWKKALSILSSQYIYLKSILSRIKYKLYVGSYGTSEPANSILGLQTTISGSVSLASLVPPGYGDLVNYALVRNLGSSPIQINNSIYLLPGYTLRAKIVDITVQNLNQVTLTSSQPVQVGVILGGNFPTTTTAPSGPPTYAITVQNSQSDPTPTNFQLLLSLNLQGIVSSMTVQNLLSLKFCQDQQCSSPLYAWIENYDSSTYDATVWVLLPNGIPANSSITIYMQVTNSNQYPYTGINAYYDTSYDNGANVFDAYLNAMGTSLVYSTTPTYASSVYSSMQYEPQSNGIPGYILMLNNQACAYTVVVLQTSNSGRLPEIFEAVELYSGSAGDQIVIGLISPSSSGCATGQGQANVPEDAVSGGWNPNTGYAYIWGGGTCQLASQALPSSGGPTNNGYNYYQLAVTSSSATFYVNTPSEPFLVDYSSLTQLVSASASFSAYGSELAVEDASCSSSHVGYLYWFRARAMPPNNVMPSLVSIQKVS